MNYSKDLFGICPITTAQKILGGKWTIIVLYYLSQGTLRFGELQRKIPDLTQAMLTKQLRSLESYGLVHREVYPEVPPKVEYSLTNLGKEFIPVLDALSVWGESYKNHLNSDS
ncbi:MULTISPECIES: helix-turn-helix domain-containing protein [Clostridium]|uniref:Helix-turn-helix transcriptional regulator n=1 Tax=Clostridium cibarium TaxID=2762247 RepID=A0ABR8PVD2_9CLOT|nr:MULTISPECIES: helix-turn-helix domain-containing protein [Clostridium]MBD7912140.1 helix-turn-helix transcriptional regulator [Clostridium cibarium]